MENEELIARIKAGTDTSNNMIALWNQNKGMICNIIRKYRGLAEVEDLQQESYIALCAAVDGYDPDKGCNFLSYAVPVIDRWIRRYIYDTCSSIRIPGHTHDKIYEYKKMIEAFEKYLVRKPTRQEAAYNMGLSDKVVRELERTARMGQVASLDVPLSNEDDAQTLVDMVPDAKDAMAAVIDSLQQEQLKSTLWNVVDSLPDKQGAVIRARFQRGQTLKATGEELGISLVRASTIQNQGLKALRTGERRKILMEYYNNGEIYSNALKGIGVGNFNRTWTSSTERVALKMA